MKQPTSQMLWCLPHEDTENSEKKNKLIKWNIVYKDYLQNKESAKANVWFKRPPDFSRF